MHLCHHHHPQQKHCVVLISTGINGNVIKEDWVNGGGKYRGGEESERERNFGFSKVLLNHVV